MNRILLAVHRTGITYLHRRGCCQATRALNTGCRVRKMGLGYTTVKGHVVLGDCLL